VGKIWGNRKLPSVSFTVGDAREALLHMEEIEELVAQEMVLLGMEVNEDTGAILVEIGGFLREKRGW
jgi:hypothetical protein